MTVHLGDSKNKKDGDDNASTDGGKSVDSLETKLGDQERDEAMDEEQRIALQMIEELLNRNCTSPGKEGLDLGEHSFYL